MHRPGKEHVCDETCTPIELFDPTAPNWRAEALFLLATVHELNLATVELTTMLVPLMLLPELGPILAPMILKIARTGERASRMTTRIPKDFLEAQLREVEKEYELSEAAGRETVPGAQ